jgi:hypothetical protein
MSAQTPIPAQGARPNNFRQLGPDPEAAFVYYTEAEDPALEAKTPAWSVRTL